MMDQDLFLLNEKFNILMNVEQEDKVRFKSIMAWAGQMMELSIKEKLTKSVFPKRREIWTCNFGENVGSEINRTRPCLIFQNDTGNLRGTTTIVIPITKREERLQTHVGITNEDLVYVESSLMGTVVTEQIRLISKARLGRKIGELSEDGMKRVEEALKMALGMEDPIGEVLKAEQLLNNEIAGSTESIQEAS